MSRTPLSHNFLTDLEMAASSAARICRELASMNPEPRTYKSVDYESESTFVALLYHTLLEMTYEPHNLALESPYPKKKAPNGREKTYYVDLVFHPQSTWSRRRRGSEDLVLVEVVPVNNPSDNKKAREKAEAEITEEANKLAIIKEEFEHDSNLVIVIPYLGYGKAWYEKLVKRLEAGGVHAGIKLLPC